MADLLWQLMVLKRRPERQLEGVELPFWFGEGNDLGVALAVVVPYARARLILTLTF